MHSVDWDQLPTFIKDAVQTFPFSNKTEAAEFLLLLTSRVRARLASLPPIFEGPLTIDCRAAWSWKLYHEMLAGERFIGRCALANWQLEVPTLYEKVYAVTVNRFMLDRDRRESLKDLANLPSDPRTEHYPGFPWETDVGEPSSGSLDLALSNYRQKNRSTPVAASLTMMPPEFLTPLLKARENLTQACYVLNRMADSLDLDTRTGHFLNNVLTLVERRLEQDYGVH